MRRSSALSCSSNASGSSQRKAAAERVRGEAVILADSPASLDESSAFGPSGRAARRRASGKSEALLVAGIPHLENNVEHIGAQPGGGHAEVPFSREQVGGEVKDQRAIVRFESLRQIGRRDGELTAQQTALRLEVAAAQRGIKRPGRSQPLFEIGDERRVEPRRGICRKFVVDEPAPAQIERRHFFRQFERPTYLGRRLAQAQYVDLRDRK